MPIIKDMLCELINREQEMFVGAVLANKHVLFDTLVSAKLNSVWYEVFLNWFIDRNANGNTHSSKLNINGQKSTLVIEEEELDDLLFFVRPSNSEFNDLVFVRRKVDDSVPMIREPLDWPATCLLNLVYQTQYFLLVSVCSREFSKNSAIERTRLIVKSQSCNSVYASHHEVKLKKDEGAHGPPASSYPLIYFQHGCASSDPCIVNPDQILCVELIALVDKGTSMYVIERQLGEDVQEHLSSRAGQVLLFQGAVTYDALKNAAGELKSPRQLISPHSTVLMRGPGGKGLCQVVVKDQSFLESTLSGLIASFKDQVKKSTKLQCSLNYVNLPMASLVHDMITMLKCEFKNQIQ